RDLVVTWTANGSALVVDDPLADSSGNYTAWFTLPAGEHSLRGQVLDTDGATGTDTVVVTVRADTTAPTCAFSSPASGSNHPDGTVRLQGTVTDDFAGPLGVQLASDVAGVLVPAASLTAAGAFDEVVSGLAAGPHVLTLTATDEGGNTCEDVVQVTVCADVWYLDADEDDFGDPSVTAVACEPPPGHVADATDCDDGSDAVRPGATEVCDGIDNDCDSRIDDEDDDVDLTGADLYYADVD